MLRTAPERTLSIRRETARLCMNLGWSTLHEVPLRNGRRADIFALLPSGEFVCIEIKSGARDFLTDGKWPHYRDFCDAFYFAIDAEFPQALLPEDTGLIVAGDGGADIVREPPAHGLASARRRTLLHQFARLAADRLFAHEDPAGAALRRAAASAE